MRAFFSFLSVRKSSAAYDDDVSMRPSYHVPEEEYGGRIRVSKTADKIYVVKELYLQKPES